MLEPDAWCKAPLLFSLSYSPTQSFSPQRHTTHYIFHFITSKHAFALLYYYINHMVNSESTVRENSTVIRKTKRREKKETKQCQHQWINENESDSQPLHPLENSHRDSRTLSHRILTEPARRKVRQRCCSQDWS
jgi:hypothetical protein